MATDVNLPALGESVTEGTVTQWLKSVGDEVAVDEPLLEVSTDKVDTEVPSPVAGTLLEIKVDEDETVEVGAVLAVIGEAGESTAGSADEDAADETADHAGEESGGAAEEQDPETSQSDQPSQEPDDSKTDEGAQD
nr:2-oxoglutarate dehydrogenase, E2 component, dihydrolipoamide succinyltransferase [Propionibacteriales bacterium]